MIKSTFTRKTKDSIVIGEHAFSGDTVRALPGYNLLYIYENYLNCFLILISGNLQRRGDLSAEKQEK